MLQIKSAFSSMSVPATIDVQPRFDWSSANIWYALYYVAFMFCGSIFVLQLFIGVSDDTKVALLMSSEP